MEITDGEVVQVILTLSIIGFSILFTLFAAFPVLADPKVVSILKKEDATPRSLLKKIECMKGFNFRFMSHFRKSAVIKKLLVISLAYLLSAVISIGNVAFQTQYSKTILSINTIFVFMITTIMFSYMVYLFMIANGKTVSIEDIEEEILWLAENEE